MRDAGGVSVVRLQLLKGRAQEGRNGSGLADTLTDSFMAVFRLKGESIEAAALEGKGSGRKEGTVQD